MKAIVEESWNKLLRNELESAYFRDLKKFLVSEKKSNQLIYPAEHLIFNAFEKTPVNKVKVILIGQDPYHGPDQANGLSFSVNEGLRLPPSLKNIFKELNTDLHLQVPISGNLESWAIQGVLLLNTLLTVRAGEPGSHHNRGWEQFTDAVIRLLSEEKSGLVFLLWGRFAQSKEHLIDQQKHFILKSAHPSPFSAHHGFYGSQPFSKINTILINSGNTPINWNLNKE